MNLKSGIPLMLGLLASFSCTPLASAGDLLYEARRGDTLWDICLRFSYKSGCWKQLGDYNEIDNDRAIAPGSFIRIPRDWLVSTPTVGEVLSVSGDVRYDRHNSGNLAPLAPDSDLHLGGRIVTGEGSARLRLGRFSELLLREHSQLILDSLGKGASSDVQELRLQQGEVESEISPGRGSHFQIRTPEAIAAVRGTRYRVNTGSAGTTRSEVLAGAVNVAGGAAEVDVTAGYGVASRAGQPPGPPRKLLPPPALPSSLIESPLPVALQWPAHPQAVAWQLDIYAQGGDTPLQSVLLDTPAWRSATLALGCYRLVLRAADAEGFKGLDATQRLCVLPATPPPEPEPEPNRWWEPLLVIATVALIIGL